MEDLVVFFLFIGVITIFLVLLSVGVSMLQYIFTGIGLMKIGERLGEKAPWLSWIPYASTYLIGKMGKNKKFGILLVILYAVSAVFGGAISVVGTLAADIDSETCDIIILIIAIVMFIYSVAVSILYFIACHGVFKKLSEKATIMTVFNVLTGGAMAPIFFFSIRNNKIREEINY